MRKDEDLASNACPKLLRTSLKNMDKNISWRTTPILRELYNVAMIILNILAAVAVWFQTVADESSSFLHLATPCWPGGSDYGPPEVEIDDSCRRPMNKRAKLLKIRESLIVRSYIKSTTFDHHRECTVCLSEFCDMETVYELPQCKHTFHKPCLNQWLQHRRTTCPLCRSSLLLPPS
ncbi:hypothetical protein R1flu_014773 [Riccia fluitans]|uniref:RING-type domain-containing protein n=1 Tax=Riccia fluitans TaxID=41844 RepID=A0ABD1YK70_9MARC